MFIQKNGVTPCPPCFSEEFKAMSIRREMEGSEQRSAEMKQRWRRKRTSIIDASQNARRGRE